MVAGAGFAPAVFGLWAQRDTSSPPRNVGASAGSSGNTKLRSVGQTRCYAPAIEIYQTVGHVGYLKIKKILFVKPPYALALRAGPTLPLKSK